MIKKIIVFLSFGILWTNYANADLICYDLPELNYSAEYIPNNHTCPTGTFLPANIDGCQSCPQNTSCPGGEFSFNENIFQGLNLESITGVTNNVCANNLSRDWYAVYQRNQHTCTPGYYMPANTDGCVACPANSYCSGGTFTFNETVTQGIDVCPVGTVAPTGMWEADQCGRTLHVGGNTIYLRRSNRTTPSLHFDMDGDGVADLYANVTATDTVMNRDSSQKLKLQVGNTTYSVCDDTILGHE